MDADITYLKEKIEIWKRGGGDFGIMMSQVQGASLSMDMSQTLVDTSKLATEQIELSAGESPEASDRDCGKYKFVGIEILLKKHINQCYFEKNEMLKLQVLMALYENEDSERNVSSIAKSLKWNCNCYINS